MREKARGGMMKIGVIFPGQGSEYDGMCKAFFTQERMVQEYFDRASHCLDMSALKLCFGGRHSLLHGTKNIQLALFITGVVTLAAIRDKLDFPLDVMAGHSCGEYAALCASGGFSFEDGLYLVRKRAECMQRATQEVQGCMYAVLGLPGDIVAEVCRKHDDPSSQNFVAQVANYNAPTQTIITGTEKALQHVAAQLKALKGRVIPLKVTGAFHSRLMNEAEASFRSYLYTSDFYNLKTPVVSNSSALIMRTGDEVVAEMKRQMSSSVLWWQSMQHFCSCDLIIQVGPGDIYARMLKREWPEKHIISVSAPKDLPHLEEMLLQARKDSLGK